MSELDLKLRALRDATDDLSPSTDLLSSIHAAIEIEPPPPTDPTEPAQPSHPNDGAGAQKVVTKSARSAARKLAKGVIRLAMPFVVVGAVLATPGAREQIQRLFGINQQVKAVMLVNGKYVPCEPSGSQIEQFMASEQPKLIGKLADAGVAARVERVEVRTHDADGARLPPCSGVILHPKTAPPSKPTKPQPKAAPH